MEKSRQTKDLQALDTLREEVTLAIIDGDINEHANANACYFFGGGYDNAYVTSSGGLSGEEVDWFKSKLKTSNLFQRS